MTDKNKVIDDVYKHPILGHGSIQSVYKEAKWIDKAITLNGVQDYFSKLPSNRFNLNIRVIIHV